MVNRTGTVSPCGSNKGFSSRFYVDSWVRHETLEEGRRTYRTKLFVYNNEDEINSLNILSKNTFTNLMHVCVYEQDFTLDNLQRLKYHKNPTNQLEWNKELLQWRGTKYSQSHGTGASSSDGLEP